MFREEQWVLANECKLLLGSMNYNFPIAASLVSLLCGLYGAVISDQYTHHADQLGQRHHQLHGDQLRAVGRGTDQFVVVGRVQEMLHQPFLCVGPEATWKENTSSSSPSQHYLTRRSTLSHRVPQLGHSDVSASIEGIEVSVCVL